MSTSSLINSASFRASLARIGNTPATVDSMARYALFHGAQGQFTPANSLMERLHAGGMTGGYVGRAAMEMLADGLKAFAVLNGPAYKVRKGCESMGTEGATLHATSAKGIEVRMAEFSTARALAKEKAAAKVKPAPVLDSADSSADEGKAEAPAMRADGAVVVDDVIALAVAEAVAPLRIALDEANTYRDIAQQNAARAFAAQHKAEADAMHAAEIAGTARAALEVLRAEHEATLATLARLQDAAAVGKARGKASARIALAA